MQREHACLSVDISIFISKLVAILSTMISYLSFKYRALFVFAVIMLFYFEVMFGSHNGQQKG